MPEINFVPFPNIPNSVIDEDIINRHYALPSASAAGPRREFEASITISFHPFLLDDSFPQVVFLIEKSPNPFAMKGFVHCCYCS